MAVTDEQLTRTQLARAQLLYDKGAISLNDLQVAQDTDAKAKVDVKTTAEKLRVLGSANLDQPTGIVEIRAPVSGVITDQQVTNAAGVAGLGSPNPISQLDEVNRTLVFVGPFHGKHFPLIPVNLHDRTGTNEGPHCEIS